MAVLQTLVQLQTLDSEWDDAARRYQELGRLLADDAELAARRTMQGELEQRLNGARARQRDHELELETVQRRRREIEAELYSGEVVSPRELEGLRRDGEHLRERVAALEEQVLDDMAEVEELEQGVANGARELAAFERRHAQERAQAAGEYQLLRERLRAMRDRREALRAEVNASTLALYDNLRAKKGGRAMAPVRDGLCQVCRVSVPSSKADAAASGDQVCTCDGCGRILCVP